MTICKHVLLANHSHELFVGHARVAEDPRTVGCVGQLRGEELIRFLCRKGSSRNPVSLMHLIVMIFKSIRQVIVALKAVLVLKDRNLFCFLAQRF